MITLSYRDDPCDLAKMVRLSVVSIVTIPKARQQFHKYP